MTQEKAYKAMINHDFVTVSDEYLANVGKQNLQGVQYSIQCMWSYGDVELHSEVHDAPNLELDCEYIN